jgi:uncharacterized protein
MELFYTIMAPDGQPVQFEFDKAKSLANKLNHGLDFIEAQRLWLDPDLMRVPVLRDAEERWLAIGMIGEKHWSVIITYRGTRVRLISARRSRPKEVAHYERR